MGRPNLIQHLNKFKINAKISSKRVKRLLHKDSQVIIAISRGLHSDQKCLNMQKMLKMWPF